MYNNINEGITLESETLETERPTKRTDPTGGVQSPIHKFITIIIPK